jgi:hypothetical protein
MGERQVQYGKVRNVVILIFPDEKGTNEWIGRLETEKLLQATQKFRPAAVSMPRGFRPPPVA